MSEQNVERQSMEVDIACVGFGPAMGGFLTHLSRGLKAAEATAPIQSPTMPGAPPTVICYEKAEDLALGVSGVESEAKAIKASFPDFDPAMVPMTTWIKKEKTVYLLDPIGASRRPLLVRLVDPILRLLGKKHSFTLPFNPPFLHKKGGIITALGQFNQWVAGQVMAEGAVQIWPSMAVEDLLLENNAVTGVRLADQGVDKEGKPAEGFMPGMDIKAKLTVVGDGPIGSIGRKLNEKLGMPEGRHLWEWAVGMKFVVSLPEDCPLEEGTVIHTIGFPEPEIFGFFYVMPNKMASMGIFVPSWMQTPYRTSYRYLQYWIQHPYLWQYLKGGKVSSFGAKSLLESGIEGEPHLVGDGFARIGEGSGTTNILTNSGVDEAWASGRLLAEAVLELMKAGKPFTRENLDQTYVAARRKSDIEKGTRKARHSRDGFRRGFIPGMVGMALAGFSGGLLYMPSREKAPHAMLADPEKYYRGSIPVADLRAMEAECRQKGGTMWEKIFARVGWPEIAFDGSLLISHQDALLLGGKVQAVHGYRDHVLFDDVATCETCRTKSCVEICSGQAIARVEGRNVPSFDREKCVHCGACVWGCARGGRGDHAIDSNIAFLGVPGGLHSAEN